MSPALIKLEAVTKVYRRGALELPVLQGIDLEVQAGDFVALMGPSGSGKTTLLNLIASIERATSGCVWVGGRDIAQMSERERTRWRASGVGFVFQRHNLIPVLSAFENVELPLLLAPLSAKQRKEHVAAALAVVGLSARSDHRPSELSGGESQRVAIARAIVTDPQVLLADEPTGDLDARSAAEVLELLVRLNAEFGRTIIAVTHDPKAAALARRILHLEKGVMSRPGGASPLRARAAERATSLKRDEAEPMPVRSA